MTILDKLFNTTAFKLSVAYLLFFAVGTAVVLGGVDWDVNALLDAQIGQTIDAEITGLSEQYETGGIRQLFTTVERRTEQPGSSLYLITDHAGQALAGNVATLPDGVIDKPGLVETSYERRNDTRANHLALARVFLLPSGFRLLVGRDLEEREALRTTMFHALFTSLLWVALVGLIGGLAVSLKILRRVDAMSATAVGIMGGDMARRLPVAGTGDEIDRLAENLNAMIARIGGLLAGMQEVSDNIAHDLRTPLTRLRNGAEEALRQGSDAAQQRRALEAVIGEADGLIAVFNALLLIARAEAGSGKEGFASADAGSILSAVVDLYEPVAEEAGVAFRTEIAPNLAIWANRELLSQAIANLVDNALKYGADPGSGAATVTLSAHRRDDRVDLVVADGGPGVPEADRTRVVERFVRLEGSRSRPGSGLGLSLAAAIARLHGGELQFEDNQPGLRVVLSLPAAAPLGGAHVASNDHQRVRSYGPSPQPLLPGGPRR